MISRQPLEVLLEYDCIWCRSLSVHLRFVKHRSSHNLPCWGNDLHPSTLQQCSVCVLVQEKIFLQLNSESIYREAFGHHNVAFRQMHILLQSQVVSLLKLSDLGSLFWQTSRAQRWKALSGHQYIAGITSFSQRISDTLATAILVEKTED